MSAEVRVLSGKTKNYIAYRLPPKQSTSSELPLASRVEIVEEDDGYYLFRYSAANEFAGDSWFETIEQCKRQAKFEYGIEEGDWKVVD